MKVAERAPSIPARIIGVTFATPSALRVFGGSLPLPTYSDPERALYAALGFGRTTLRRALLHPRVWWRFFLLLLRGYVPRHRPGDDTLQLGGDVVLDAEGRVRWVHGQLGPEDYPPVPRIAEQVARLS